MLNPIELIGFQLKSTWFFIQLVKEELDCFEHKICDTMLYFMFICQSEVLDSA